MVQAARHFAIALSLGLAGACSEPAPAGSEPDASSPSTPKESGAPEPTCAVPDHARPRRLQTFSTLSARVVDDRGRPVENVTAQACGKNLCLSSKTDTSGRVVISDEQELDRPAFKYGLGFEYVKFALPLAAVATHDLGDQVTVPLPEIGSGADLTAGVRVSSGGATLELSKGAHVDVDGLTYAEGERVFRASAVPLAVAPQAVDAKLGLELVYGLAPVETTMCPAGKLSLPNDAEWPAGAAVEFFVHGLGIEERFAPYGGWAKVSDGAVSDDARTVSTLDGEGIPILSVVGVRLK